MNSINAWTQFWTTVLPYAASFCVALFSVGALAVYNWGRTRGLAAQVDKLGAGGPPAPAPQTVTVTVPQGAPAAGRAALAAPVWNQLDDPLPDGVQDPYAGVDCGEECAAMAVAALGGLSLPAYVLRACLGLLNTTTGTTGAQLVYLLRLLKVPAHTRSAPADAAWIEWEHSYAARYLVIARGYWVQAGMPHWVLIRQTDAAGITFNDPYGGHLRTMSKEQAQKCYLGDYVHIDAPVTALAPDPPLSA